MGNAKSVSVAHVTTIDMGLRYLLLNQMQSIQEAGYVVTGISSPGPDVPTIKAAGIRHVPISITRRVSPSADLVSLWRLYRCMRRERFTIVHTHNPKPGLLGQLAARLARVPIVVNTLHGFYFHEHMHLAWRWFYITTEKIAARCSDVILSQNSEDIETAVCKGICTADKISYLGNGIDLQRFDPERISPEEVALKREELGLAEDAHVVGFVGRMVREKGLIELFEAARQVRLQQPDMRLVLIGSVDTDKADAVRPEIADEYGMGDICIYTGLRHDMPEMYALMDVFVLPSHREGFPRSAMEASAMGIPCVATDIRGCREAVKHGQNGLLVPMGDVDALASAILAILNDQEKASILGKEGREMARRTFDEQLVFERVKRTYAHLLQAKGLSVPASLPRDETMAVKASFS